MESYRVAVRFEQTATDAIKSLHPSYDGTESGLTSLGAHWRDMHVRVRLVMMVNAIASSLERENCSGEIPA